MRYVHYQLLYAIFVAGFVGFILLLIYTIKFKQGRMINKVRRYVTYLFMQLPFSLGLLYFSIDVFREGTFNVYDSPIPSPSKHYPYNMILAIFIIAITVFQIIHFYWILSSECKNKKKCNK